MTRCLRLVDRELRDHFWPQIAAEHERGKSSVLAITGKGRLLEGMPRLQDRLTHRDPWVDPLSHLQIELPERTRADASADRQPLGHRDRTG